MRILRYLAFALIAIPLAVILIVCVVIACMVDMWRDGDLGGGA